VYIFWIWTLTSLPHAYWHYPFSSLTATVVFIGDSNCTFVGQSWQYAVLVRNYCHVSFATTTRQANTEVIKTNMRSIIISCQTVLEKAVFLSTVCITFSVHITTEHSSFCVHSNFEYRGKFIYILECLVLWEITYFIQSFRRDTPLVSRDTITLHFVLSHSETAANSPPLVNVNKTDNIRIT